ncbi:hypothetical protein [Patulibacter defluvii]|uniref:hypothetical protein n=1 Tax=Patulibacter defluvii TaxID=3095358 RepID=UPI002A74BE70|nr:hypothetical protein [Patulibacter sp. DM4]
MLEHLRTRAASVLAVAVVAAGIAGCGGDDDKGGGGPEDYGKQLNGFCQDVNASVGKLQTDLVGLQGKFKPSQRKEAGKAVEKPLKDYVESSKKQLDKLEGLTPPDKYKSFHEKTVKTLTAVVKAVDDGTNKLVDGDLTGFQKALAGSLQGTGLEKLPADLKKDAPACAGV